MGILEVPAFTRVQLVDAGSPQREAAARSRSKEAMTDSTATMRATAAPAALKDWAERHEDLMVVDVRSGAEFASRMGTRAVPVCQSGARAEQARKRLGDAR